MNFARINNDSPLSGFENGRYLQANLQFKRDNSPLRHRPSSNDRYTAETVPDIANLVKQSAQQESPIADRKLFDENKLDFEYGNEDSYEEPIEPELLPIVMDEIEIRQRRAYEWVFGRNLNGELSLGVKKNAIVPAYAIGLKDVSTKQVCSSSNHTILLASNGKTFFAGSKLHGKLGKNSDGGKITIFQQINIHQHVKQVACNDYLTLLLLDDASIVQLAGSNDPKQVTSLAGIVISDIACGEHHCLALDANGDVYSWGTPTAQYNKGQLGHGDLKPQEFPKRIEALEDFRIVKIACGGYHTIVLAADDTIFAFGSGAYGELGTGEVKDSNKPKRVELVPTKQMTEMQRLLDPDEAALIDSSKIKVKSIVCGGRHSLVLAKDGRVFSFGFGQQGQLGHGNCKNFSKPTQVQSFLNKPLQLISAGSHHSIVMTSKGDLYVCGSNTDGQLGLGDTEARSTFTWLRSLADKNVHRVFCGGNHSWVLIDEFLPIRLKARAPSPLYEQPLQPKPQSIPVKTNDKENSVDLAKKQKQQLKLRQKQSAAEATDYFIRKVMETHQKALAEAAFTYQVTYCATKYCHRYINFEIERANTTLMQSAISHFAAKMTQVEGEALLLSKLQQPPGQNNEESEDSDQDMPKQLSYNFVMIVNPQVKYEKVCLDYKSIQEQNRSKRLCLHNVTQDVDGKYQSDPIKATTELRMVEGKSQIAKVVVYKAQDCISHPVEKLMGQWCLEFQESVSRICKGKPRYSEMRPFNLC